MQKHSRSGFSLVELAIVLVIIGLIVGGILTGQDLIKASELNAVVADANKFKTAINTFRLKYNGLPGDIKNATSYWTSGTGNGNGDNNITAGTESARATQQLGLAGLIPGSYTGTAANPLVAGTDAIPTKLSGGIMIVRYSGGSAVTCMKLQNNIEVGKPGSGVDAGLANQPLFNAPDSYTIDAKHDDGLPCAGNIRSINAGVASCPNWNATSGSYTLSNTQLSCALNFATE